jgi:hypothetical protein
MNQVDATNQEIRDDHSEYARESTLSFDIEGDDLDHEPVVLHLGQARRDKAVHTTMLPLPKKQSHANTVIACPLLLNFRNLSAALAPPLLKGQKSSLIDKVSESGPPPSPRAPVLPVKSSGDHNIAHPKPCTDQNVPQHQKSTFEVAKRFMEAIIFTKTQWPILSDNKYLMVEEAWKPVIEAQDRQRTLEGVPEGTPSVCQLPNGRSLKIDPQTRDAVSHEFCSMHLYQTDGY